MGRDINYPRRRVTLPANGDADIFSELYQNFSKKWYILAGDANILLLRLATWGE